MAEAEGKVIVTLESDEKSFEYDALGVTFDSTPEEILDAVQAPVLEEFGVNIKEGGESIFTVKKIDSSGNIYVFPKSPAGKLGLDKYGIVC